MQILRNNFTDMLWPKTVTLNANTKEIATLQILRKWSLYIHFTDKPEKNITFNANTKEIDTLHQWYDQIRQKCYFKCNNKKIITLHTLWPNLTKLLLWMQIQKEIVTWHNFYGQTGQKSLLQMQMLGKYYYIWTTMHCYSIFNLF